MGTEDTRIGKGDGNREDIIPDNKGYRPSIFYWVIYDEVNKRRETINKNLLKQ